MRTSFFIVIICFSAQLFSQKVDTREYYNNGQLADRRYDTCYYVSDSVCRKAFNYEYWYRNGYKRVEISNDPWPKYINAWLPDGQQILFNGNGYYVEVIGDSVVAEIKDSVMDGISNTYRKCDGKTYRLIETQQYKKGIWDGVYKRYDCEGALQEEGEYKLMKRHGNWKYYFHENEKGPRLECNYNFGNYLGKYIEYYQNGRVSIEGSYIIEEGLETLKSPYCCEIFKDMVNPNSITKGDSDDWKYYDELGQLIEAKLMFDQIEMDSVNKMCDSLICKNISNSQIYVEVNGIKYEIDSMLLITYKGATIIVDKVRGNHFPETVKTDLCNSRPKGYAYKLEFREVYYRKDGKLVSIEKYMRDKEILFPNLICNQN